jgi:hypothetical protein
MQRYQSKLRHRAQDQDAQLHRWNRLPWVGHRAGSLRRQVGMLDRADSAMLRRERTCSILLQRWNRRNML